MMVKWKKAAAILLAAAMLAGCVSACFGEGGENAEYTNMTTEAVPEAPAAAPEVPADGP